MTLHHQRFELPFKAVLITSLDSEKRPLTHATGFIRRESNILYLYTCWHFVTGYDRNDLKVQNKLPDRKYLQINMQDSRSPQPGIQIVGSLQSITLPLYETSGYQHKPIWLQDDRHFPHPDLNAINIFVPFWHDAVKIALPSDTRVSDIQVLEEDNFFSHNPLLTCGDKVYLVGYPYGFSAQGAEQPTPIVLTRFIASPRVKGRHQEVLLDGAGARSMSGGPVFVERGEELRLLGLYTGLIYPDHSLEQNDKITALGTCSDMTIYLQGGLPMVANPSQGPTD